MFSVCLELVLSKEKRGKGRVAVRVWDENKESKWEPRKEEKKAIHHKDESHLRVAFCSVCTKHKERKSEIFF